MHSLWNLCWGIQHFSFFWRHWKRCGDCSICQGQELSRYSFLCNLKFYNFLFSISQYFNLFVWSNMLSVENSKDVGWWLILFFPTLSFFLHLVQIKCICRTAWHALCYFLIHHVMRLSNWRRGICLCFLNILHYLIDMMHYKFIFNVILTHGLNCCSALVK